MQKWTRMGVKNIPVSPKQINHLGFISSPILGYGKFFHLNTVPGFNGELLQAICRLDNALLEELISFRPYI